MQTEIRIGHYQVVVSLERLRFVWFKFDGSNAEIALVFKDLSVQRFSSNSGRATLAEVFQAARELGVIA